MYCFSANIGRLLALILSFSFRKIAVLCNSCLHLYNESNEKEAIQNRYLQPIITQYFIGNKSEIWSLSLIVHSKG